MFSGLLAAKDALHNNKTCSTSDTSDRLYSDTLCAGTKKESAFPPEAEIFGDKKKVFVRRRRKFFDDIGVFHKHGERRILEKIEATPMDPRLGTRV